MFFVLITKVNVGSSQSQSIVVDYYQHLQMKPGKSDNLYITFEITGNNVKI